MWVVIKVIGVHTPAYTHSLTHSSAHTHAHTHARTHTNRLPTARYRSHEFPEDEGTKKSIADCHTTNVTMPGLLIVVMA